MKIRYMIFFSAVSLLTWSCIFVFALKKDLTMGIYKDFFRVKISKAIHDTGPRFFVIAGSNGLYSHDAETFEKMFGIHATNLSMVVNFPVSYLFRRYKKMLRAGDIVYLPLEYRNYSGEKTNSFGDVYDITIERRFNNLDIIRFYKCFSYFELHFLVESIVEQGLVVAGFKRRVTVDSLTPYGDFSDNLEEKAPLYSDYLNSLPKTSITYSGADPGLKEFLTWASDNKIIVIGGLPTTFEDTFISEETIKRIEKLFVDHGALFLTVKNKSLYPRDAFYDTAYHLTRRMQIYHSTIVADAILEKWPALLKRERKK